MIIYCKRCLYPDTKPDLTFNHDGVCSACIAFDMRANVDWREREREFSRLVDVVKQTARKNNSQYDVVVPVSGGKDSYYQLGKALSYDLRVLAVNAHTCDLSDIGHDNLVGISKVGVDLTEVVCNSKLRSALNKYCLETVGDISWPEHVAIFSVPVRIAMEKKIPLVLWGENPQNEYGGPQDWQDKSTLIADRWLQEFGGLNGLRLSDVMLEFEGKFDEQCFNYYKYPEKTEFSPEQYFLGQFFPWDGYENYEYACKLGFKPYIIPVESNGFTYENLDNYQTGIHDYFKYIKFGFGRATDMASSNIRRGRMTRDQGIKHVQTWDGNFPSTYLGEPLYKILARINIRYKTFIDVCDKFTNSSLFDKSIGIKPLNKQRIV